jgi:hypothetical protein
MPVIKISLDAKSFKRLAEVAGGERRPIPLQAEVMVLQALGCWPVSTADRPAGEHHAPVTSE